MTDVSATKFTISDGLRYLVAVVCLIVIASPAGWVMLYLLSDFSLSWVIMGGSHRLHRVLYYAFGTLIALVWLGGTLSAEGWFRSSIDNVRLRRARAEIDDSVSPAGAPKSRLLRALQKLGLDLLFPRVVIAAGILFDLMLATFVLRQFMLYVSTQFAR